MLKSHILLEDAPTQHPPAPPSKGENDPRPALNEKCVAKSPEKRCSNESLAYYTKLWQTNPTGETEAGNPGEAPICADRRFLRCRKVGQGIPRSGLPACGGLARLWRAHQTMRKSSA